MNIKNAVINNILCYISTARHTVPTDDIVSIAYSYYDHSKITSAKSVLYELTGNHATKRRSEDKIKVEIRDMLDLFDKLDRDKVAIPKFLADSYDGLPPATGFSVASRNIATLLDQVEQLNKGMSDFWDAKEAMMSGLADQADIKSELSDIKMKLRNMETSIHGSFPPLSMNFDGNKGTKIVDGTSFASVAALQNMNDNFQTSTSPSRPKNFLSEVDRIGRERSKRLIAGRKPLNQIRRPNGISGTRNNTHGDGLRGSTRLMDLYIGRCDLDMDVQNVIQHCKDICNMEDVKCEELASKVPILRHLKFRYLFIIEIFC
jgi:hypothetical protein